MTQEVIDAEVIALHIEGLKASFPGVSERYITRMAGVGECTTLMARRRGTVTREIADRILSVQPRHILVSPPWRVPVAATRNHIRMLVSETGESLLNIARASGLDHQTIRNVMTRGRKFVEPATQIAVMKVTADQVREVSRFCDRTVSVTRLRALQANGWSLTRLGEMERMNLVELTGSRLAGSQMEKRTADRIKALYDRIGDTPGGSARCVNTATALGYHTPIHYDDDMNLIPEPPASAKAIAEDRARTVLCILRQVVERRPNQRIVRSLGLQGDQLIARWRRRVGITILGTDADGFTLHAPPGVFDHIRETTDLIDWGTHLPYGDKPGLHYRQLLDDLLAARSDVA